MLRQHRGLRLASRLAIACLVLVVGRVSAADSPWFVGAKLGQAHSEARFGARHPQSIDDEAETGALEGGYILNRYLAVQVGYHDLGSYRGVGSPCPQNVDSCIERLAALGLCVEDSECAEIAILIAGELSGFSVALVPSWPLGNRFTVQGKVGLLSWRADIIGSGGFGRIEGFSGEDVLAGLGLRYDVSRRLGLLIEYEEVDLDLSSTSIGMRWRF